MGHGSKKMPGARPALARRANAPPPAITSAESHTKQSENLTGTVRLTVPKMTLSPASGDCARLVLAQGGCKTVINNTFGEVELPLKYRASCGPYSHASNSNISHGVKSHKKKALVYSAKQNVVMTRRNYHKHDPAGLSLYNWNTTGTHINGIQFRKNQKDDRQTGSSC